MKLLIQVVGVLLLLNSQVFADCLEKYRFKAKQYPSYFSNVSDDVDQISNSAQPFWNIGDERFLKDPHACNMGNREACKGLDFADPDTGISTTSAMMGFTPSTAYAIGNSASSTIENTSLYFKAHDMKKLVRVTLQAQIGYGNLIQEFTNNLKTEEGLNVKSDQVAKLINDLNLNNRCVDSYDELSEEIMILLAKQGVN